MGGGIDVSHYIRFDALNLIMEECTEAVRQSSRVSVVWKYWVTIYFIHVTRVCHQYIISIQVMHTLIQ